MGNLILPFAGNPLDRSSDKRGEKAWLAMKRAEGRTRVVPIWRQQPLLLGAEAAVQLSLLSGEEASRLGSADAQEVFLGLDGDVAYFARDISAADEDDVAQAGVPTDGRSAAMLLPQNELAMMGQAKALLDWHARHRFCAHCGAPTESADAGYRRVCASCEAEHFPRTDPAVIMLAIRDDRCLLGHNKRFPPNRFSTLAGFVEPGESIEEAVRREIYEEVAIRVGEVHYFATQPWPFPASLMIGCFAEALNGTIHPDGTEIVSARWFTRATARRLLAGEDVDAIQIPGRQAIAHHLIRTWAEK